MRHFLYFLLNLFTFTDVFSQIPKKAELLTLNGTNIYYEAYGKGEPLFLLHGYTWSSRFWYPFINDYTNEYEVYLVDLKGHGKSGMFNEKLSIESAAKDLGALINYLKLDSIKAIGYSYGGMFCFNLPYSIPDLLNL